jgi:periplasmic protein TonB
MHMFRWVIGLPFATIVTVGLFLMMSQLVRNRDVPVVDPKPSLKLQITAKPEPEPRPEPKRPDQIIPKELPPTEYDFERVDGPTKGPAPRPGPTTIDPKPPGPGAISGAIIRIPPPYPENCRSRGVEGVVVVEFDVTPEGNVANPRVTSTPNSCFNRAVIKAVSGWKYPPAPRGGMRYGLVETFNFQLQG